MVSFFRKKTDADTAKRKPNGAANNGDGDGANDATYPPPGKFRGPMTINGEGTMDAGETDGTAGERKKGGRVPGGGVGLVYTRGFVHLSSEMGCP